MSQLLLSPFRAGHRLIVTSIVAMDSNQPLYSNPFFVSQFGKIEVSLLRNGKLDRGGSGCPCPTRSSNTAASVVAVAIESTGGVVGSDFECDD